MAISSGYTRESMVQYLIFSVLIHLLNLTKGTGNSEVTRGCFLQMIKLDKGSIC